MDFPLPPKHVNKVEDITALRAVVLGLVAMNTGSQEALNVFSEALITSIHGSLQGAGAEERERINDAINRLLADVRFPASSSVSH